MTSDNIIDTSKPSAGRIYDYLLGGHHNFEVDRLAAERVSVALPFAPKFVRLQRWCLQDLAVELTAQRGYDIIIDFASGLPTNDHLHHVVPDGTTVIYSDYDPIVVEYAREILADTPNTHFFQSDARRPEELLDRPAVQEILAGRRNVALIYWGIAAFLSDDDLLHAVRALYEWSGPKSCWAFQAQGGDVNMDAPSIQRVREIYASMGNPLYLRSMNHVHQLIHPWRSDEPGFVSLLDWHSLEQHTLTVEDRIALGEAGGGYGAYLVK
ncbi:MAG: SAM-dependent methyltransferase [Chloroflexales bacterium]|nr:SAM-dependent methyltransferase [Chloroflexales bacterium]